MLHSQLIEQTGGTAGVRDFNLLESAIETPFQVFGGEVNTNLVWAKALWTTADGKNFPSFFVGQMKK